MHCIRKSVLRLVLGILAMAGALPAAAAGESREAPVLVLEKGDRICILGNTLAERLQHGGWLETLIHDRFPEHDITIRNLGFSGDEVAERLRCEGFGSPDDYLKLHRSSVVLAFFGFNESFAGEPGLENFRKDLENFIGHTLDQKYDGEKPPRMVLFSPIGHEDLGSPDLPDGRENNRRIGLYAKAMAEVASARGVPFVDLFSPSMKFYDASREPLTINGIHLNETGNRLIAEAIDAGLFGRRQGPIDWQRLEKLRKAVMDRNFYWFNRYRTTDGFNVYGGRSHLKYTDGLTNRVVMQREMEILDAQAANRDRRIWAIARGGDLVVDDGNTPEAIPVKTNHPGPGPGGAHVFLGGEEAIEKMKAASGMKVNLVASEEKFPDLVNPVQMSFDTKGRLWVAAWRSYPHYKPRTPMDDKLLILENDDRDGRAERCKVFAGGLNNPTGFEFYRDGVITVMGTDLLFLRDTDGDDRADQRELILHGLGTSDSHHTANSFVFGPGGGLYFQEGVFHRTQIETPYGLQRNRDACVWRFEPRTWKLERYIPYGFANPHGHVVDRWGQDFVTDGTGAEPFHGTLFSGYLDYPRRHSKPPKLYNQRTRPCPATEILSSSHFPAENQGNLLVANVIGFLGILQYKIEEKGASFHGTEIEPIVQSSDPNFRPADIEIGPDGAIWFTDWQNPIIGHMQHHIRDPNRDQSHGRVYRITCEGRPLLEPVHIAGEPIEKLLDLLKSPEDRVRYRARTEIGARETAPVLAAVKGWIDSLDPAAPDYQHHLLEALWIYQQHNTVNSGLLERVLRSPDHRARAAATRVLCQWRDRVSEPLALLKVQVADEHPLVRLEAVRACSFFKTSQAAEIALESLNFPQDEYLKFTLDETMKALDAVQ